MGLTIAVEQRLQKVGLVEFFDRTRSKWLVLAQDSYVFMHTRFPNETVRRDDIADMLFVFLQRDDELACILQANKLRAKYWISDFADLVVDRCWNAMIREAGAETEVRRRA